MTLNLSVPGQEELKPRITVFGVGGAGGNAVNNMIDRALEGVDFVVANNSKINLLAVAIFKTNIGTKKHLTVLLWRIIHNLHLLQTLG